MLIERNKFVIMRISNAYHSLNLQSLRFLFQFSTFVYDL